MMGLAHLFDLLYGWSASPIKSFEQAEACAEEALALNDSLDFAHLISGWISVFKRQYDEAIKAGERAIQLNPNGAEAHAQLAYILCMSDETESAIKLIKRAFRLNPIPLPHFYVILAMAYRNNEQYDKAIAVAEKAVSDNPDLLAAYLTLAASYTFLNRTEEAQKAVADILRITPNFSLEYYANTLPYKNQETTDRYVEALRKAGLPK